MPISACVVRSYGRIFHLKAAILRFISQEEIIPGFPVMFVKMRSTGSNGPTKTESRPTITWYHVFVKLSHTSTHLLANSTSICGITFSYASKRYDHTSRIKMRSATVSAALIHDMILVFFVKQHFRQYAVEHVFH
jgi:hypothetical protein